MTPFKRRTLLAAALTLPAAAIPRKPAAAEEKLRGLDHLVVEGPVAVPELQLTGADGAAHGLDRYAGHGVVLNLWATWCVPCVAEMAALDELARKVDGDITVLALSSDRGGAAAVERFYRERGIRSLPVLLDPRGAAGRALGARGIPTTLLIDRTGRERARLEGAADWSSAASIAAIRKAIAV
ncbi:MAG TPA: TlpA disulfide reductase family protein [Acetobacteraceae bacterium]